MHTSMYVPVHFQWSSSRPLGKDFEVNSPEIPHRSYMGGEWCMPNSKTLQHKKVLLNLTETVTPVCLSILHY